MNRSGLAGVGVAVVTAVSAAFAAQASHAAMTVADATPPLVVVTAGKPTEYVFKVSRKSVKHGTVIFKLVNAGKERHGFTINGFSTKVIRPHASTRVTVVFKKAGRYVYQCVQSYASDDEVANLIDSSSPLRCGGGVLKVT